MDKNTGIRERILVCVSPSPSNPRVFMVTLRKKLETSPESPRYIQTHIGIGYRMLKVD